MWAELRSFRAKASGAWSWPEGQGRRVKPPTTSRIHQKIAATRTKQNLMPLVLVRGSRFLCVATADDIIPALPIISKDYTIIPIV